MQKVGIGAWPVEPPTQDSESEEGSGHAEVGRSARGDSVFVAVLFPAGSVAAVFFAGAFLLSNGFAAGLAVFVPFAVEAEAGAFFSDVFSVFFSADPFATVF
ncbi:hypothetical protein [Nitrosospira sp. Nsp2]|uniref:hypothetical protein n=1 Tax=Nitrosospira sp. Nsp2 TaxID=136548 RepID=UPI0011B27D51|nr:hypothetical protein [Nitrosospira sp. Nsp2]